LKINTDKKIYYAVCTTLALFIALLMIYREIPSSGRTGTKEIKEKLIPEEVTAETYITEAAEAEVTSPAVTEREETNTNFTEICFKESPVNLNTADLKTLMTLKGIGEKKARNIIEYRNTNGAFSSADELISVPGIGKKTAEAVKDFVTV